MGERSRWPIEQSTRAKPGAGPADAGALGPEKLCEHLALQAARCYYTTMDTGDEELRRIRSCIRAVAAAYGLSAHYVTARLHQVDALIGQIMEADKAAAPGRRTRRKRLDKRILASPGEAEQALILDAVNDARELLDGSEWAPSLAWYERYIEAMWEIAA